MRVSEANVFMMANAMSPDMDSPPSFMLPVPPGLDESISKAVYDQDDRHEIDEYHSDEVISWSKSVGAMVRSYRLQKIGTDGSSQEEISRRLETIRRMREAIPLEVIQEHPGLFGHLLEDTDASDLNEIFYQFDTSRTLSKVKRLCPGVRFEEQPVLSKCTGFLVAEDIVITAGHCVSSETQCRSFNWVFGYKEGIEKFTQDQVYNCQSLITKNVSSSVFTSTDYAIIRLDRKVKDVEPLKFATDRRIRRNLEVLTIGHPDGLPMKIADNGFVTSRWLDFFRADLDTFVGNSGSPVFNARNGEVEGVLIEGQQDYIKYYGEDCYRNSIRFRENGSKAEKVLKIHAISELMKAYELHQTEPELYPDLSEAFKKIERDLIQAPGDL